MLKRWAIFLFEYIGFLLFVLLLAFTLIEPYVVESFKSILQEKTGLEVEVEAFFFAPNARVEGQNLKFTGLLKGRKDSPVEVHIARFSLLPQESFLGVLLEDFEKFSFTKLRYRAHLKGVYLKLPQSKLEVFVPEIDLDASKFEEKHMSLKVNSLVLSALNQQFEMDRFEGEFDPTDTRSPFEWIRHLEIKSLRPLKGKRFSLNHLLLERQLDYSWQAKIEGVVGALDFSFSSLLKRLGENSFSLNGPLLLPNRWYENPLDVQASGPFSQYGQWDFKIADRFENTLKLNLHASPEKKVFSYDASLTNLNLPILKKAPLRGQLFGGVKLDDSGIQWLLKGENIEGTVFGVQNLSLESEGSYVGHLLNLKTLRANEGADWSFLGNATLDLAQKKPLALDLKLVQFPLSKYSPTVSGLLDVDAHLKEGQLDIKVHSDRLHPDKDPLQMLDDFKISISINSKLLEFRQDFQNRSDTISIGVDVETESLLDTPFVEQNALVKRVSVETPLFKLFLAEEAKSSLSIRGMEIKSLCLKDETGRLEKIEASGFVPFLNPSELLLTGSAAINLSRFPLLAGSALSGTIIAKEAVWDKGWAISNLRAKLEGKDLGVLAPMIFDPFSKIKLQGWLKEGRLDFDSIRGQVGHNGQLEAHGWYNLLDRKTDVSLKASKLVYEKNGELRMDYDIKSAEIKGEVSHLAIGGNIELTALQYHKPIQLLGTEDMKKERPLVSHLGSLELDHQLDIKLSNTGPLMLKNNLGELHFNLSRMRIHGPLTQPLWSGSMLSETNSNNKITLPARIISTPLNVERAELLFENSAQWNPRVILEGSTQMNSENVTFKINQKLNDLGEGDFKIQRQGSGGTGETDSMNLSEGKSFVADKKMLDNNTSSAPLEVPVKGTPKEIGITVVDPLATPRLRTEITPMADKRFIVEQVVTLDEPNEPLEINLSYQLTSYLKAEVNRRGDTDTFFGFRFSRQFEHLYQLWAHEEVAPEFLRQEVEWTLSGTDFFMRRKLKTHLSGIEPLLQGEPSAGLSQSVLCSVEEFMHAQGFPFAEVDFKSLEKTAKEVRAGLFSSRKVRLENTFAKMQISQGQAAYVKEVSVNGLPPQLPVFEDPWMQRSVSRAMAFNPDRMDIFRDNLLAHLAENGYLGAKIAIFQIEALKQKQVPVLKLEQRRLEKKNQREKNLSSSVAMVNLNTDQRSLLFVDPTRENLFSKRELKEQALQEQALQEQALQEQTFRADHSIIWKSPEDPDFRKTPYKGMGFGVQIGVEAGNIYRVVQVAIFGNRYFSKSEILKAIGYLPNQPYKESDLKSYQSKVAELYVGAGWYNTEVRLRLLKSQRYDRVSLHLDIYEGERWRLDELLFEGLVHTKESFLRSYLQLEVGQVTGPELDRDIRDRLERLSLFSSVELRWQPSTKEHHHNLCVVLKEKKRFDLSAQVGYSTSDGSRFGFRATALNLSGRANTAFIETGLSSTQEVYRISYNDPHGLGYALGFSALLEQDVDEYSIQNIANERRLFELRLSRQWHALFHQSLGLQYVGDDNDNASLTIPLYQVNVNRSLRLDFKSSLRAAPLARSPERGLQFKMNGTYIYYLNLNQEAYRGDYVLSHGFSSRSTLIIPWLRYSNSYKFGRNFDLPLADRSFLGGPTSLRGFKKNYLSGPHQTGGESLLAGGMQWVVPIYGKLSWSLFYEGGQVFEPETTILFDDLQHSFGTGALLRTPIGPLQIVLAKPTGPEPLRFEVQLGTHF